MSEWQNNYGLRLTEGNSRIAERKFFDKTADYIVLKARKIVDHYPRKGYTLATTELCAWMGVHKEIITYK